MKNYLNNETGGNMSKVDISIVVPIYNAEKYIKKCVDSLLNQTKEKIELILINDGSTDSTEEIIKEYKDERIKYFKNKNQGIGMTRNFGIDKAKGKYIMFIDSDDYIEKDACEKLFEKAENSKLDLVICNFYKVYDNGEHEDIILPSFKNTTLKETPSLIRTINLSPWNKLYRTSLIKNNNMRFVENLKYEDAPFVSEALDKAKKIGKVDESLNYYVIHGNSETTVRDRRIFDILKIVDLVRKQFKGKNYIKEDLNKLTVRIITNYTIQQRMQNNKKVGMEFIDKAFAYMKKEVPDFKKNKYYEERTVIKRTIEKSKLLSKIYCLLYRKKA